MCIPWRDHVPQNVPQFFVKYCLIGQIKNQVKFMNISTEHIPQCKQSESLADASGRIVDLINENGWHPTSVMFAVDSLGQFCICSVNKRFRKLYPRFEKCKIR